MASEIDKTVAQAVKASIEANVLAAMNTEDTMRAFVAAALNEQVEVRGSYGKRDTLLNQLLQRSIEQQTRAVISDEVAKIEPRIREEVRAALRKSVDVIADSMVDGLVDQMKGNYPSIKVEFRGRD